MHSTASVFINDNESGLHADYERWMEELVPFNAGTARLAPSDERDLLSQERSADIGDRKAGYIVNGCGLVNPTGVAMLNLGQRVRFSHEPIQGRRAAIMSSLHRSLANQRPDHHPTAGTEAERRSYRRPIPYAENFP